MDFYRMEAMHDQEALSLPELLAELAEAMECIEHNDRKNNGTHPAVFRRKEVLEYQLKHYHGLELRKVQFPSPYSGASVSDDGKLD